MPTYEFQGVDSKGKAKRGTVEAESERILKQRLRSEGIYVTKVLAKRTSKAAGERYYNEPISSENVKIRLKEVAEMTRQLAILVKARIPLVQALAAVYDQNENQKFREVISHIKEKVNEGSSLAKAMREYPRVYSPIYTSMIRAGEASGALDIVLQRLADFIEKSIQLRNKVVSSMVYPIILGTVSLLIVFGLLTFVVPKMTEMFQEQGRALPLLTIILINISTFAKDYWYLLLGFIMGFLYLFRKYIRTENGRKWYDGKLLSLPLFGTTIRKIAVSRFSRTLSTLLASGVPLISALEIVRDVVVNVIIGETISEVKLRVQEGESLAKNLKESGHFPPIVTHMIAIGEKSGGRELEEMLERVAETYDREVESALVSLTSIIEPIMIVGLGGFVAFVVLAILMPIWK